MLIIGCAAVCPYLARCNNYPQIGWLIWFIIGFIGFTLVMFNQCGNVVNMCKPNLVDC
jgi:hypothetical protein